MSQKIVSIIIPSLVGFLKISATDTAVIGIYWEKEGPTPARQEVHPLLEKTKNQLSEYFEGKRTTFDLPLELNGTPFQKRVWEALLKVPFGATNSYLDLAKAIKNPSACRAVGRAVGQNPVSIVVPCHRIIGSNGKLTGFAGGLEAKSVLLKHEECL